MRLNFLGATDSNRSRKVGIERTVNWYPLVKGSQVAALMPPPGLKLWSTISAQPVRGLHTIQQGSSAGANLYAVIGPGLYSIDSEKTATILGSLNSGAGPVTMTDNGVDLVISDGQYQSSIAETYVWETDTATLKKLNDPTDPGYQPAAPRASHCVFVDSYVFLNDLNTGDFYISASGDAALYDGTYATAESNPDNLLAMEILKGELWLSGELATEVWTDSGAAGMPFDPLKGATRDWGISAIRSLASDGERLIWLAKNRRGQHRVMATQGYEIVPVSAAIDYELSTYSTWSDAVGWCYMQEGMSFYVLTFPAERKTWVLDIGNGLWHERESYGHGRWLPSCHAFAFNKHLVGDYSTGKIYELDLDTYTDAGQPIVRKRISAHTTNERKYLFCDLVEVEFEPGVGAPTGQGVDPQVMLRESRDGGFTFGNEHWRSVGAQGEYLKRARWWKRGRARDWVWDLTVSDPIKWVVTNAFANMRPGR